MRRKILMGVFALALPVGSLVAFTASATAHTLKPPTVACTGMTAALTFTPSLTTNGETGPTITKTSQGSVGFANASFTGCTEQGNPAKQDVEAGTFTGSITPNPASSPSNSTKLPHVPHQPPAYALGLCSSFLNAKSSSSTLKALGTLTVTWSGAPANVTGQTSVVIKKASGTATAIPASSPPQYNIIFAIKVKATGQFKGTGLLNGVIDKTDSDNIFDNCAGGPVSSANVISGAGGGQPNSNATF